ncbi:MAG: 3-phosphoserine/phosphohydroxythreonine transaminase [Pirellulaceae bacterium]
MAEESVTKKAKRIVKRMFNFSAGPAVMPVPVLEQIRDEMLCLPGVGASVMEISHRSDPFLAIQEEAKQRLIGLLAVPQSHEVLFLQGGSRLQFSMIPMNLLRGQSLAAKYLVTGTWGKSAYEEAIKEGPVDLVWDGKATNYDRLPEPSIWDTIGSGSYLHVTSNETIQGVQFQELPGMPSCPLVCDSSSDFLHRPVDISRYGILYACAQKNAGPAGVTIVVIEKGLLQRSQKDLPGYLSFRNHAENDSMWNTPPTFAIYALGLVAKWLEETVGGLDAMLARNQRKAERLYDVVDRFPQLYQGHAQTSCRSLMNVTFRLPSPEVEKAFLKGAQDAMLDGLKGHRSVGGIRASIYNAMPEEGVETLASYMEQFAAHHG